MALTTIEKAKFGYYGGRRDPLHEDNRQVGGGRMDLQLGLLSGVLGERFPDRSLVATSPDPATYVIVFRGPQTPTLTDAVTNNYQTAFSDTR